MKEINLKKDLRYTFDIIAERYQRISRYKNTGAQLLHKGRAVVYVEDTGIDKTEFLLDKKEREAALKNPDLFLDQAISQWIDNDTDQTLAFYEWYPEEIEDTCKDSEKCRVLIVGCFFGYEPINWAKNDASEDIVFTTPALAQDWIDEQESGTYYLQQGEAGRPEYYIISY